MHWQANQPGVVTLTDDGLPDFSVDCLMCPFEPLCYDVLCEFLPDTARAAEVGCFQGGSACILANGMSRRNKTLALACHDLFEPFEANGTVHDIEPLFDRNTGLVLSCATSARIRKVKGDSKVTHELHPGCSLDYVFIDGDHTYEGALADINNFKPKLRPNGFLLVQDSIGDVQRAVLDGIGRDIPVVRIEPPSGHYITVLHRDVEVLERYANRVNEECRRVHAELDNTGIMRFSTVQGGSTPQSDTSETSATAPLASGSTSANGQPPTA